MPKKVRKAYPTTSELATKARNASDWKKLSSFNPAKSVTIPELNSKIRIPVIPPTIMAKPGITESIQAQEKPASLSLRTETAKEGIRVAKEKIVERLPNRNLSIDEATIVAKTVNRVQYQNSDLEAAPLKFA
jgi:hypothetical protein